MGDCILAGDIGGTKTLLATYAVEGESLTLIREERFASREFDTLEAVVERYLAGSDEQPAAAAFGVAGPVIARRIQTTNLAWAAIEAEPLARTIGVPVERLGLLNDLEAMAYGALFLPEDRLQVLHQGVAHPGNVAVIAAGTGLGQAFLYWDGTHHRPSATEGGHNGFSPRDEREDALMVFLRERFGHVSYERVLSGPGLVNLFVFLCRNEGWRADPVVRERIRTEDPAAVIGAMGVSDSCRVCREAVDWFVSLYGFQAANQVLTVMGIGGLYIGGGIVTKILPRMLEDTFRKAFLAKGRYRTMLSEVPIKVILDPATPLIGAAHAARELV